MPSDLRIRVREQMQIYQGILSSWINDKRKILDVGIAGDKEFPSENYKYFPSKNFKTADIDPQWRPDYVQDICKTDFPDNHWDMVILSQTLEHIFDFRKAIAEIYRIVKPGGYAIIDSPFMYIHHPEANFADYWRFSPQALQKLIEEVGFDGEAKLIDNLLTTVLLCKKY